MLNIPAGSNGRITKQKPVAKTEKVASPERAAKPAPDKTPRNRTRTKKFSA
jgi:hypothetical protein